MTIQSHMKATIVQGNKAIIKSNVSVPKLTEDNTALVKVKAVGINPTDWKHVEFRLGIDGSILGCDYAGEIVALGPNAEEKWSVGDTLCGFIHGGSPKYPENGAFAEYCIADLGTAIKLKLTQSNISRLSAGPVKTFEAAAALPCALYTAIQVISINFGNKLEWEPPKPQHDHAILIWGGSTAVGQFAIQLVKKLNCYTKIITVASKKHETLLKNYGADEVYDYHNADVEKQIVSSNKNLYHIFDAVSIKSTLKSCAYCSPDDKPVVLIQLQRLAGELSEEDKKPNISVEFTLIYSISGHDEVIGTNTIPYPANYRENMIAAINLLTPKLEKGELHCLPVHVSTGIESTVKNMEDIKTGRNSGVKLVTRL